MTERAEDAQAEALRAFLLLCSLGQDWPGRLVLVQGLDAEALKNDIPPLLRKDGAPERSGHNFEGRAMSVAASIAGAACLAVDSRAEVCRATLRAGACDFVVNTVDEALRVLKNEIRKRKPVSVALAMPEAVALDELAERGVAPDVFVSTSGLVDRVAAQFAGLGARIVGGLDAATLVDDYARTRGLAEREFRFGNAAELQQFDRRLVEAVPQVDQRRRWASLAPGFFYRDRPFRRVAYVTAAEAGALGGGVPQ
jgi:urocanate hydratase